MLLACTVGATAAYNAALTSPARPALLARRAPAVVALDPSLVEPTGIDAATQLLATAVSGQTAEAVKAAQGELGWWGSYIKFVEDGLLGLRNALDDKDVPGSYGLAIFSFVLGVKLVTLPLNWNQLSSAANMKSIKPQQDLVRKWYGDNQQLLNIETGSLYEKLDVNPLAGCLPSLAQIPVFLGVYYSVTSIAASKICTEGFLWIPSLSGPIATRQEGISWLTEGWIDGAPRLGWHDTLCYLTLPCILVCTQTAALYLLGSFEALEESKDSSTQNAGLALRILPFMLGWFAMNAPSALGLYWVCNNILTTLTTVTVKKLVEKDEFVPEVSLALAGVGPRRAEISSEAVEGAPDWMAPTKALDQGADGEVATVDVTPSPAVDAPRA